MNHLVPLVKFLNFFNISIEEYFSLKNVPFPVVNQDCRVAYRTRNGSYMRYDMRLREPTDSDRTSIDIEGNMDDYFVDCSTFNHNRSKEEYYHRLNWSRTDSNRVRIYDTTIESQTRDSSTDLTFCKETGHLQRDLQLVSPIYPFTSMDLVNEVHPYYEQINDPSKYVGFYCSETKTISIVPITLKSTKTGNTTMTTTENILDQNKAALITATKLEVGNIALDLVTQQVLKALPAPVQLLVGDNPAVKIAVANLINLIVAQLNINDPRVGIVNEAMMTVAYMETLQTFNFKQMLDNALSGIPAEKLALLQPQQDKAE